MFNLPEELPHLVAGHLAYNLDSVERELPEFHYKHATGEIRSLALVCCRLRRICLPFLLAFLRVRYESGMNSFKDQCLANPKFAESIKTLYLTECIDGSDILRQLLPRLRRLSWVHFETFEADAALLLALHDRFNGTIVLESAQLLTSMYDASKVLLHRGRMRHPRERSLWQLYLSLGMQVAQVTIHQPHFLHEDFGSRRFSGLRGLDLIMGRDPIILFWLSEFTSAHPQLRKIRFQYCSKYYFKRNLTLPFISGFVDRLCREDGLNDAFDLTRLVVSRNAFAKQSSEQWRVTGLKIVLNSSLYRILRLINSSFPNLSVLSLDFQGKARYCIDPFIEMLRRFPSLKTLGLRHAFNRLHNGCDQPWTRKRALAKVANQFKKTSPTILAEAGMCWYTTCIAQASSLEAFFVHEQGVVGCEYWTAAGWYTVQNAPGCGRCVVGELDHRKRIHKDCEI